MRAFALAFVVASASAAIAKDDGGEPKWTTRVVRDDPAPLVLDPAKAYILIDTTGLQMPAFAQVPDAAQATAWDRKREAEFAKEHAKWEKKFAGWQREMKSYQPVPGRVPPKKPVEPSADNFGFPAYELAHQFMVGPENRFNKDGGSRYLQEVPPGRYALYKAGMACACLGTVAFDAAAGKVTTLGLGFPFLEAYRDGPKDQRPKTTLDLPAGVTTIRVGSTDFTDARFPVGSVVQARFLPAGRYPNWGGGEVDRVMPIAGVFHYERDKQVAD